MRQPILVSVIVRTRDRPQLLAEALESVANQRHRPLEVVVVNDGGRSVDDVVSAFAERVEIRLVVHPTPKGRAAAANAGVREARGAWVGFLDDDDLYLPQHVTTVLGAARAAGTEVAYAGCRVIHPVAGPEGEILARPFDPDLLALANYIPTCSVMVLREALHAVGGFDEELPFLEDWELWIRLAQRGPFAFTGEVTSIYRAGPASVGGDMAAERWAAMERVLVRHWQRVKPGALVRRFNELERDIAALRRELARVGERAHELEQDRARLTERTDELAARVEELRQRELALSGELHRLRAVAAGASRLRVARLLAWIGRLGSGANG